MTTKRQPCPKCGTMILPTTAKFTDGICMLCFNNEEHERELAAIESQPKVAAFRNDFAHSLGFKSCAAIVGDTESRIAWSGLRSLVTNGAIDDLYLFRNSLFSIGAKQKSQTIKALTDAIETHFGGVPLTDRLEFEITEECSSQFEEAQSSYEASDENVEKFIEQYSNNNEEEIQKLRHDSADSEYADTLLERIFPS